MKYFNFIVNGWIFISSIILYFVGCPPLILLIWLGIMLMVTSFYYERYCILLESILKISNKLAKSLRLISDEYKKLSLPNKKKNP